MKAFRILPVLALLAAATPAAAETIAIVGATVWERPGKKLDNATVVIRDGAIAQVGAGVAAPAGARVIDGKGKVVTAGFIEAFTQIGLATIDLEPSSVDGRMGAVGDDEIHAAYRARDAFDGRSVTIPVARTGGVTSVVAAPVGALIAGQSSWYTLADPPTGAAPAPIVAAAGMNAALGGGATRTGSRGTAIERLREALDDAASYQRNRAAYERNQERRLAAERLDLEALGPVLRGQVPLVIRADAESDLRAALDIARERRLRLVIVGAGEGWRVAADLAAAKVPVILDPSANLPGNLAAIDVRDDNATVLAAAGVDVAISTLGDPWQARTIRQLAGMAVARGLPWDQGLAALTTVPAKIYGGGARRGTVARGAAGDVVVWSGDPLELSSRAEVVIIGGVVQSAVTHQTRLRDRYRHVP